MYKTVFPGVLEAEKLQKHKCTLFSETPCITVHGGNLEDKEPKNSEFKGNTPNTNTITIDGDNLEDKEPKNSEFKGNPQTWGLWWCWISECGYVNYMPQDWCAHCGHSKYAKNGNVHLNNLKRKLSKMSGGTD